MGVNSANINELARKASLEASLERDAQQPDTSSPDDDSAYEQKAKEKEKDIRKGVKARGGQGKEEEKQAIVENNNASAKKRAGFFGRLLGTPFRITAACTKACTAAAFTVPFILPSRRVWKAAVFSGINPVTIIGKIGEAMKKEYEITHDKFFGKLKSPNDKNHP